MRRALTLILVSSWAAVAQATPHDLPFSYPYATLGKGQLEIEQYTDLTPVQFMNYELNPVTSLSTVLTTEMEYGLTDHLELGLYFQFSNNNDQATLGVSKSPDLGFDGIKQRLRYRLGEAGRWPVDISIYGEISEFMNEIELEAKLNFERRFGPLRLLVNLWGEHEFYYSGNQEWVVNPTAGGSWQITPAIHLGLEYWAHGEYGGAAAAAPGVNATVLHSYLGPALSIQGARFWCTVAPYLRLDRWNATPLIGDQYGMIWIRMIIGVEMW